VVDDDRTMPVRNGPQSLVMTVRSPIARASGGIGLTGNPPHARCGGQNLVGRVAQIG
jgi:hypothetical protein